MLHQIQSVVHLAHGVMSKGVVQQVPSMLHQVQEFVAAGSWCHAVCSRSGAEGSSVVQQTYI